MSLALLWLIWEGVYFLTLYTDVYNDIKKLETCEYTYLHLHFYVNFYVFPMGYFVLCVPHPLFMFGFKHFISFNHFIFLIAPVLCPNSLNLRPYLFFFLSKLKNHCTTCYKRGQRQREIEKKNKNDGEQTINSNLQTTFTREILQYRQVKMMCQNLFPYLHL